VPKGAGGFCTVDHEFVSFWDFPLNFIVIAVGNIFIFVIMFCLGIIKFLGDKSVPYL
jgi:uncharacterized protein (DUF983 family)